VKELAIEEVTDEGNETPSPDDGTNGSGNAEGKIPKSLVSSSRKCKFSCSSEFAIIAISLSLIFLASRDLLAATLFLLRFSQYCSSFCSSGTLVARLRLKEDSGEIVGAREVYNETFPPEVALESARKLFSTKGCLSSV
jgi:hypothetical protein